MMHVCSNLNFNVWWHSSAATCQIFMSTWYKYLFLKNVKQILRVYKPNVWYISSFHFIFLTNRHKDLTRPHKSYAKSTLIIDKSTCQLIMLNYLACQVLWYTEKINIVIDLLDLNVVFSDLYVALSDLYGFF